MIERAVQGRVSGPRWGAGDLYRHGHAHGSSDTGMCGAKTFNALSGRPLARLRHETNDSITSTAGLRRAGAALGRESFKVDKPELDSARLRVQFYDDATGELVLTRDG